jgi:hypothetical protein
MSSNFQITRKAIEAKSDDVATPPDGAEAAREALRSAVYRDTTYYPNDGHTPEYHRGVLSGNRYMPLCTFELFLEIMNRRGRRETVRRILGLLVRPLGFELVDLPDNDEPSDRPMSADATCVLVSAARLQVEITNAMVRRGGHLAQLDRNRLVRRCDSAIRHIREVSRAIEVAS